jgi:uncharacterized protein (DUF736 family)
MEQRNNSGVLFRNHRKNEGSKQPDYRGELMIDGAMFEISAWEREGKRGRFLSIAIQDPGSLI